MTFNIGESYSNCRHTIFKLRRDVQLLVQKYGVKIHVSLCEFYVPL